MFFGLGDSFTRSGVDGTRGLGVGGLIRCAGRPREWSCGAVPPQERWHEGWGVVFWLGGFFHTLGSGRHERVRGGGFNPLRGATTGVVMRRRATSGEMARGVGVLISACALGDSIPPQKKRVGRGINPKTDARSSRHNHPVPPDCFYDSTGAACISRRSVCSPRKVE